jgi:hypothetical protein
VVIILLCSVSSLVVDLLLFLDQLDLEEAFTGKGDIKEADNVMLCWGLWKLWTATMIDCDETLCICE